MRIRHTIWAAALVAAAGCSGGSPTSPTDAPTFSVTGRVADANTRLAIPGVTLTAVDGPNAGKLATTSTDGRYTLETLLGGTFRLRARRDGYEEHVQDITVTNHTNIDFVMIPGRSLGSGWAAGSFFAEVNGARVGSRIATAEVSQSGSALSGSFTTADGSSGSFSGSLAGGTQFSGTFRADLVTAGGRCRGTASGAVGNATPNTINIIASVMAPENCGVSITNLSLTLTP